MITAHEWQQRLRAVDYHIDLKQAKVIADFWELRHAPLLFQGVPGGGKTVCAEKIAAITGAALHRLPCYDGVGPKEALYSWNRLMQKILLEQATGKGEAINDITSIIYNRKTLLPGVFMRALLDPNPDTIVLIDEIDKVRQNKYFVSMMLEFLASFSITIIETGEIIRPVSGKVPHVFITSNANENNRLAPPLLRRVKFMDIDAPTPERMYSILCDRAPRISTQLRWEIVRFVDLARRDDWEKPISLSETINWAQTLELREVEALTEEVIEETMGDLAKGEDEMERLREITPRILRQIRDKKVCAA
jgi:MoxR-like ATPase